MRGIKNKKDGVSNVIGYILTFAITTMVVTSSVLITNGLIDDKKNQVAQIEAQKIADYVANAITDAVTERSAMPEGNYSEKLDLPSTIGGKDYYIDVTNNVVSVGTYDGGALAKCGTFSAEESGIGVIDTRLSGGSQQIRVTYEPQDTAYKLDFGWGDSFDHSPVKAGYYRIDTTPYDSANWYRPSSPYRVPIVVQNPTDYNIDNAMVKIQLNSTNFDYNHATVIPANGNESADVPVSQYNSDLYIYQYYDYTTYIPPPPGANVRGYVDANITPQNGSKGSGYEYPWYAHWAYSFDENVYTGIYYDDGNPNTKTKIKDEEYVYFNISEINASGTQYPVSSVIWNTVKLHYGTVGSASTSSVPCAKYEWSIDKDGNGNGTAYFDRKQALSLLPVDPKETIYDYSNPANYTFSIEGMVVDRTKGDELVEFWGSCGVEIRYGDWYVSQDGTDDGSKTGRNISQAFATIQHAIDSASQYDTVYINGSSTPYYINGDVYINKKNITIAGKNLGTGNQVTIDGGDHDINDAVIYIKVNGGGARLVSLNIENGGASETPYKYAEGIEIEGCSNVAVINCDITKNYGHGIYLRSIDSSHPVENNIITGCKIFDNYGSGEDHADDDSGCGVYMSYQYTRYNVIMNCEIYNQRGFGGNTQNPCVGTDGILLDGGACYNTIYYCHIHDNCDPNGNTDNSNGIRLLNTDNDYHATYYNEIIGCKIHNQTGHGTDGIEFYQRNPKLIEDHPLLVPSNNYIVDCEIYDCGTDVIAVAGIWLSQTVSNVIRGCNFSNIWGKGIWIYTGHSNTIETCTFKDMYYSKLWNSDKVIDGDAVFFDVDAKSNIVQDCTMESCQGDGIEAFEMNIWGWNFGHITNDNIIRRCDFSNCGDTGICIQAAENTIISQCNIHDSNGGLGLGIEVTGYAAVTLSDVSGNTIEYCNIYNNAFDGICLSGKGGIGAPIGTQICNCNFFNNGANSNPSDPSANVAIRPGTGWIKKTKNTDVYQNNFLWKSSNTYNAYDFTGSGEGNLWDLGSGNGNWWSDLATHKSGGDYIIDPNDGVGNNDHNPCGPWAAIFPNLNVFYWNPTVGHFPAWYGYGNSIESALENVTIGGTLYISANQDTFSTPYPINITKSMRIVGLNDLTIKPGANFPAGEPLINISAVSNSVANNNDVTIHIENINFEGTSTTTGIKVGFETNYVKSEDLVHISNCNFKYFDKGINITGTYSKKVAVTDCVIEDNNVGIKIDYTSIGSQCNIISNTFNGNKIGINVSGSNNNIYSNHFGHDTNNPNVIDAIDDNSVNSWDSGYLPTGSGGNYWDYYHSTCDEKLTRDIYSGASQNIIGGDNFVDTKVQINKSNGDRSTYDYYPLGGDTKNGSWGANPNQQGTYIIYHKQVLYSIDYWNPEGESVLLARMTIPSGNQTKYYIYYGGGKNDFTIRSVGSGAYMYDNFGGLAEPPIDTETYTIPGVPTIGGPTLGGGFMLWYYSNSSTKPDGNGILTLNKSSTDPRGEYILTNWLDNVTAPSADTNCHTYNEEFYAIEASVKLDTVNYNASQVNLILLGDAGLTSSNTYNNTYVVTLNRNASDTHPNKLYIDKRKNDSGTQHEIELINNTLQDLDPFSNWIRIKSYVYISRNAYKYQGVNRTNATDIETHIYDLTSYNDKGSIEYRDWQFNSVNGDTNDTYIPFFGGKIGIGCGILNNQPHVLDQGSIKIDWIRAMKIPIVQPDVQIGPPETSYHQWLAPIEDTTQEKINQGTYDPFNPGPALSDYHESSYGNIFCIKGLKSGSYTITLTHGKESRGVNLTTFTIEEVPIQDNKKNPNLPVCNGVEHTIGSYELEKTTGPGEYSSKSIVIQKLYDECTSLNFIFGTGPDVTLLINSMIIEKNEEGIRLTYG